MQIVIQVCDLCFIRPFVAHPFLMSVLEIPTDLMASTKAKATGNVIHVLK